MAVIYLVREPDGTTHLPVTGEDGKPDHRLMGAAWAALHGGYRGNKYAGPDKAKALSKLTALYKREKLDLPEANMHSTFALEPAARQEGALVIRRGKIFEGGDFPDKSFAIAPDELAAAVAAFTPVPIDLEHTPSPLDGKLGELRSVELGADGWTLYGEVALPAWLDAQLEGTGRKVSATWDRQEKTIAGLALVNHPRIADAALLSAFAASNARHDTYEGQSVLQNMHDMASRSGAICDAANAGRKVYYVSKHENAGMQAMHDTATAHGAKCSAINTSPLAPAFKMMFAGSRHSAADLKDIQAIHDLAGKQGAACAAPAKMGGTPPRRKAVSFWAKLTRQERDEARESGAALPDEGEISTIERQVEERVAAKEAAFTAKLLEATVKGLKLEAEHKADALVQAGKLLPPERDQFIAFRVNAATEDAAGTATFGTSATSRVAALDALYDVRPAHGLFGERTGAAVGLPNQTTSESAAVKEAVASAKVWGERQNHNGKKS